MARPVPVTSARLGAVAVLFLATAAPALAQSISNLTVTRNPGNCTDAVTSTNPRSERRTVGAIQSASATSFTTRYSEVVAADAESGAGDGSAACTADYTIQFDVTSPAKYALLVDTRLVGALTAADDGAGQAEADVSGVTGTQTGGTLVLNSLDLDDPGSLPATGSGGNLAFSESSGFFPARIEGTSNGVPQTHTLAFTWDASCTSIASGTAGGDESAVRLGERASYPSETASDYPGVGSRRQENDGHFVTVNLFPAPVNDECSSPIVVTTTPFTDVRNTVGATRDPADPLQSCSGEPFAVPSQDSNSVWYALTAPSDGEIIVDTAGSDYDTVLTGERGTCGALTQQGCSDDYTIGSGNRTSRIDIIVAGGQTYLFDVTDYASPGGGTLNISIVFDPDCGNGFIDPRFGRPGPGEECDDGAANGTTSSTCTADCTIRPPPSPCGNGVLEGVEQCDEGADNGTQGSCCTAECNFRPAVTPCRPPAGVCDLGEACTGTSGACPADAKSTAVCRPAVGPCDAAESCDGTSNTCPADARQPPGTVCRPAVDACDVPEACTGLATGCPADGFVPAGVPCRLAGGECDIGESCTGTSGLCPPDAKGTQVCRASAGVCDVTEECDGVTDDCPADGLEPATTECRSSAGVCDPAESCTGTGPSCPSDVKSAAVCRGAAGPCDIAESCDGVTDDCPADGFEPATTKCRGSAGVCDPAESCTGTGPSCPSDAKSTGVCRGAAGPCDVAESCDGSANGCPADVLRPSSSVCRASAGPCDVAESCTGASPACPPDAFAPDGTPCDDANTCTTADACTAGACAGVSVQCGDGTLQASCGEQCDDGNTTSGDGCSATCMLEPCGPLPETACRAPAPRRALFGLTDRSPDDRDRLLWKWVNGAVMPRGDFGDPSSTTGYQLCVYDETGGTPHLVLSAAAPAGGTCQGRPCWRATSTGFKYTDRELTPDGLFRILLKEGLVPGKGKILLKGRGSNLRLPALPLDQDPAVTVQLKSSDGPCWEARYAQPALRNAPNQFRDRAD